MSKLIKAVVGTVLRLQCPDCAEVFDLYWDIAEDVVDAVSGEVLPWVCSRCQKNKKKKEKESLEEDRLTSDRRTNTCRLLTLCGDKRPTPAEENNHEKESETRKDDEVINNPEILKKDISEIKESIIGIKQELEQLRFLILNRPDG